MTLKFSHTNCDYLLRITPYYDFIIYFLVNFNNIPILFLHHIKHFEHHIWKIKLVFSKYTSVFSK